MDREEKFDIIERYIRKELTQSEKDAFEDQLKTDPLLKREVELHSEIHKAVGNPSRQAFLRTLKDAEKEYFAAQHLTGNKKRFVIWSIAASITLLLAAAVTFYTFNSKSSPQELFAQNFKHYPIPENFRSETDLYKDNTLKTALDFYNEKKYQEALPYFSKAWQKSRGNMMIVFTRGVSYLATGETTQAIGDFTAVISHQNNMFVNQAKWYLALTYLRIGDTSSSSKLLKELETPQARTLLQQLGS